MPRLNSLPFQPQPEPKSEPSLRQTAGDKAAAQQPDWQQLPVPPLLRAQPLARDKTFVAPPAGRAAGSLLFVDKLQDTSLEAVLFGGVMRAGAEGKGVAQLQQRLTALGYGVEVTRKFGPTTVEVLKRFQADHGVEPSGEFGPTTLKALQGAELKQQGQKAEIETLSKLKPKELHALGRKDAQAFFKALLPAALESERKYGVPAVVTLVQAAVESDFARSPIGGYNIFGIKGEGPAGTVRLRTREVVKGRNHYVKEPFAKYHNFYEAVKEHGKLYNNGYYDKGLQQFAKDRNALTFIDNVAKIYATDPQYARTLKTRIEEYGLLELVASHR